MKVADEPEAASSRTFTSPSGRLVRAAPFGTWLALLTAACGPKSAAIEYAVDPATLPPDAQFLAGIDRTMGTRDCFTPVRDGRFVRAADARRMRPDERVLGVDLGSAAVAYPIQYLNLVEIVEHTEAGQELLVCW